MTEILIVWYVVSRIACWLGLGMAGWASDSWVMWFLVVASLVPGFAEVMLVMMLAQGCVALGKVLMVLAQGCVALGKFLMEG